MKNMIFSRKGMTTFMSIMIAIIVLELVGIFYFAEKKGFLGGKPIVPVTVSLVSESQIIDYLKKNLLAPSVGSCTYRTLGESELTAMPVHTYIWALCIDFYSDKTVSSPVDLIARTRDGGIEIASHKIPNEANYRRDVKDIFPSQIQNLIFGYPASDKIKEMQTELPRPYL
ncbi:MAG: hypothetical protein HYT13_01630 [Candidatus Liptonbacteria bacterium]|nr:hypothetical protein [Candidatus Liptonbacteria bacterium]